MKFKMIYCAMSLVRCNAIKMEKFHQVALDQTIYWQCSKFSEFQPFKMLDVSEDLKKMHDMELTSHVDRDANGLDSVWHRQVPILKCGS